MVDDATAAEDGGAVCKAATSLTTHSWNLFTHTYCDTCFKSLAVACTTTGTDSGNAVRDVDARAHASYTSNALSSFPGTLNQSITHNYKFLVSARTRAWLDELWQTGYS